jgi:integrase/recombinase XerC
LDGWRKILATAIEAAGSSARGKRDLALICLQHDLGCDEVKAVAIDVPEVDLEAFTIQIIGKGKTEPARVTLSCRARDALAGWIETRGDAPGPVLIRLDPAASGMQRLTGNSMARLIKALGRKAGLIRPVRPHGLRHEAITRALNLCGGDLRRAPHFSRHAKIDTLLRYDDNRRDESGTIGRLLGDDA